MKLKLLANMYNYNGGVPIGYGTVVESLPMLERIKLDLYYRTLEDSYHQLGRLWL